MSMKFEFDRPVGEVLNLLTDPDFLVERNLELGDLESDCEVTESDDEVVVRMSRQTPVELKGILARFFDSEQSLKMEEVWRRDGDDWTGEYRIEIVGQPVVLSAAFSLREHRKGSVYEISHRCKANIPLVGGKVEKSVLAQTADGAARELEYAKEKLD